MIPTTIKASTAGTNLKNVCVHIPIVVMTFVNTDYIQITYWSQIVISFKMSYKKKSGDAN